MASTDVGMWTHSQGQKALLVQGVVPLNGVSYLNSVLATQPDTNTVASTLGSTGSCFWAARSSRGM
jgi:hypothetical protein